MSLRLAQRQAKVHRRNPLRLRDARVEVVEAVLGAEAADREPVELVVEQEALDEPAGEACKSRIESKGVSGTHSGLSCT